MNTLTINSKAALILARATEKARTEKPLVKKTRNYGWYLVRSTTDMTRWYSVICNSVTREITCNCPATKPCYHIAAVAPIHSWIARQLRDQAAIALTEAQAEAANWPLPGQSVNEVPAFFATEDEAAWVAQEAAPAFPTCMHCEAEANVFLTSGDRLCWDHLKERAEDEAAKDEVRELLDPTPAQEVKCIITRCQALADAGCDGFCADCYRDELQAADDRACLFG